MSDICASCLLLSSWVFILLKKNNSVCTAEEEKEAISVQFSHQINLGEDLQIDDSSQKNRKYREKKNVKHYTTWNDFL